MKGAKAARKLRAVLHENMHLNLDALQLMQVTLPELAEAVGCEGVAAHWINFAEHRETTFAYPVDFYDAMTQRMPVYLAHMHDHPLIARYAQGSGHDVRVLSEFPEASEFYHKPLYEEYFGKLGINDQLAVRTSSHDNTWGTGFSFSRSDCGFSTSEQRVAGDFGRDLRQAVALSEERLLNKLDEEVLQQLDDGYNRCVIAVDRHRLVRQVRGPLREIIMDHVRGLARGRSLPDAFIDEVATQAPLKLPRRRHRSTTHSVTELKAFTIRWLSITDNNDGLLIVEPSNDLLTQREEEVLRLAAEGKSTRQISRQLKIRECTVSNHFHNIHQKLGVGSTKEAIWITTAGAPGANASLSAHPTP